MQRSCYQTYVYGLFAFLNIWLLTLMPILFFCPPFPFWNHSSILDGSVTQWLRAWIWELDGSKSWRQHLLAGWPWAHYWTMVSYFSRPSDRHDYRTCLGELRGGLPRQHKEASSAAPDLSKTPPDPLDAFLAYISISPVTSNYVIHKWSQGFPLRFLKICRDFSF